METDDTIFFVIKRCSIHSCWTLALLCICSLQWAQIDAKVFDNFIKDFTNWTIAKGKRLKIKVISQNNLLSARFLFHA